MKGLWGVSGSNMTTVLHEGYKALMAESLGKNCFEICQRSADQFLEI